MSIVNSIEELKQKCAEKNMPLEKMRFFIGEDRKEPKCFGVYQDESTGNWVVYKNKADGTRAVRYEGPDEARAAQEIWDKIGVEVKLRKDMHASPYDESALRSINENNNESSSDEGFFSGLFAQYPIALFVIVSVVIILFVAAAKETPRNGYYQANDNVYYYLGNQWYEYDDGDWLTSYLNLLGSEVVYLGDYYSSEYGVDAFESTDYYDSYMRELLEKEKEKENRKSDNDDDDDDDYDYDYDDWDADDTDWDTDW